MARDVETAEGRDFTSQLMDIDDSFGIKASFQVIPEKRYEVVDEYVCEIKLPVIKGDRLTYESPTVTAHEVDDR